jgi:uncharacterized protein (DUF983 family)
MEELESRIFAMIDTRSPISITSALWRGFTMRCPNCARGRLFPGYLKVADRCPNCSEDFSHHRADDFPAYLVIIVIGHIVIPAMLVVEEIFAPAIWLQYLIWLPLIGFGALALLQPTKGAVVALQWQVGMHGFNQSKKERELMSRISR